MQVEDALISLQAELTAGNTNDIGFIFERGTSGDNAAFIWDESASAFTLGTTTDTASATGFISVDAGDLVVNKIDAISGSFSQLDVLDKADINVLNATGLSTLADVVVSDLNQYEVVVPGASSNLSGSAEFTYNDVESAVGSDFSVQVASGVALAYKYEVASANDYIAMDS